MIMGTMLLRVSAPMEIYQPDLRRLVAIAIAMRAEQRGRPNAQPCTGMGVLPRYSGG